MEDLISRQQALKECKGSIYACNHIEALPSINPIDSFVDHLIKEQCQGCTECEPRLPSDWKPNFAYIQEGYAKWLLDEAERFKKGEK